MGAFSPKSDGSTASGLPTKTPTVDFKVRIDRTLNFVSVDELLKDPEHYIQNYILNEERRVEHSFGFGGFFIYADGEFWSEEAVDEVLNAITWLDGIDELLSGDEEARAWPWEESNMKLLRRGDDVEMEDICGDYDICPRVRFPLIDFAREMARAGRLYGRFCDIVHARLRELDPDPDVIPPGATETTRPRALAPQFSPLIGWSKKSEKILSKLEKPSFYLGPILHHKQDEPPIQIALNAGDLGSVQFLVRKDKSLLHSSVYDIPGYTPLHRAAEQNHLDIARWLIKAGADVNAAMSHAGGYQGRTPLHEAALFAGKEMIGLLLDKGADIEAKEEFGKTPLALAASDYLRSEGAETYETLLARGARVDLRTALALRDYDEVRVQLERLAPDFPENFLNKAWLPNELVSAIRAEAITPAKTQALLDLHGDLFQTLQNMGVDIDGGYQPALHGACRYTRDLTMADFLLDLGANVNAVDQYGKTALDHARTDLNDRVIRFLKGRGGKGSDEL